MNDSVKPEQLSVADRLATLPPEVQQLFANPEHGTPDNISKAGCLTLARLGKDEWNAWREAFPVTRISPSKYQNHADFSMHDFRNEKVDFSNFNFGDGVTFQGSKFGGKADFSCTIWGNHADLIGCNFGVGANFSKSIWYGQVKFNFSQWEVRPNFSKSKFKGSVNFQGAQLGAWANFKDTEFERSVSFAGSEWGLVKRENISVEDFKDYVEESTVMCLEPNIFWEIHFDGAKFKGVVNFSNREFKRVTSFKNAIFHDVVEFHGAVLHQDTSFDGAIFPPPTDTGGDRAARAYRTLKLSFSNQQALREEQRFFRLEMAEEAKRAKGFKSLLFWAYENCSDYGFSIKRPFLVLLAVMLIFGFLYAAMDSTTQLCFFTDPACQPPFKAMQFSLAQLPGMDKLLESSKLSLPTDSWLDLLLSVLVLLHKAVILGALFLMGLALRNLFRLK